MRLTYHGTEKKAFFGDYTFYNPKTLYPLHLVTSVSSSGNPRNGLIGACHCPQQWRMVAPEPAECEVEVTPEMVESGVDFLPGAGVENVAILDEFVRVYSNDGAL